MPSDLAELVQSGADGVWAAIDPELQEAWRVMLNWPRVTCSSRASMLAFCSKRKLVTLAMTPVLSWPMTVMVAKCFMRQGAI